MTDGTNHGEYASVTIPKPAAEQTDKDIQVGEYTITIPAGAAVSKIPGEYESVEDGLVIYITNGDIIEDWNADVNSNGILDVQENYDQFVWIPVDKETAIIEEGVEITGSTNTEKYTSLKNYISSIKSPANEPSKYPMAVKKEDGKYSGILYDFEEANGAVQITPLDYTTSTGYREPAVLTDYYEEDERNNGITEESLQQEYKTMIERVAEKGGFWVGRYETSNMNSSNFTTNAVNIVRGTTNGINNISWYKMYKGEKLYKNSEKNKTLKNSTTTSSMIWGSQWDQIMIWMKEVENTNYGKYYITNSLGMGNYETGDEDTDTSTPVATGKRDKYMVKNIYDLAGNVDEITLETHNTFCRVDRGAAYYNDKSTSKSSIRGSYDGINAESSSIGSRLTLY